MALTLPPLFVDITARGIDKIRAQWGAVATELSKGQTVNIAAAGNVNLSGLNAQFAKLKNDFQAKHNINVDTKDGQGQLDAIRDKLGEVSKLSSLKRELDVLGKSGFSKMLESFKSTADKMASYGKGVFATISGTALAGIALGSPRDFDRFTLAIQVLTAQVGQLFIPTIQELTIKLKDVSVWFSKLTDEQRASVAGWAKLALGVAAFLIFLPKIISLLQGATAALQFFIANPHVAGVLALAAAFAYLASQIKASQDRLAEHAESTIGIATGQKKISEQEIKENKDFFSYVEGGKTPEERQKRATTSAANTGKFAQEETDKTVKNKKTLGANILVADVFAHAFSWAGAKTGNDESTRLANIQKTAAFQKQIADRLAAGETIDQIKGSAKEESAKKKSPFDVSGPRLTTSFSGIADAWKHVSQSINNNDPAVQLLALQRESNGIQKQIADNTKPNGPFNGRREGGR